MDDYIGPYRLNQVLDAITIADVKLMVREPRKSSHQSLLIPSCVALRSKKNGPLVIVHAVDIESQPTKEATCFRTN